MNDYIKKQKQKIEEYKQSDLYSDEQKKDLIQTVEDQIKEYNELQEQKAKFKKRRSR